MRCLYHNVDGWLNCASIEFKVAGLTILATILVMGAIVGGIEAWDWYKKKRKR